MVPKLTFNDIFQSLQEQDSRHGIFSIMQFNGELKHKFARAFLIAGITLEFLFCISALFSKNLLILILELIIFVLYLTCVTSVIILKIKCTDTETLFDFCYELYKIEKNFDSKIHDFVKKHVKKAHERSRMIIKWMVIIFYLDPVIVVPITATVKHFLPERISPKYSLPIPFTFMIFKDQETPLAFYFTVAGQFICSLQIAIGSALLFSVISAFILHVIACLDIIIDIIELLQQDINKHFKGLGVRQKTKDGSEFNMEFWIKMIVEIVSNIQNAMESFSNLFSGFLLLIEIGGFTSMIAFGMVFLVLKQQYFLGIGIAVAAVVFFILCFVNEVIMTKLSFIRFKLYDTSWYHLNAKEMKLLLVTLNVDKLGISLNASGIHDLTLDRFASVAKGAYSNCLILKDIVLK